MQGSALWLLWPQRMAPPWVPLAWKEVTTVPVRIPEWRCLRCCVGFPRLPHSLLHILMLEPEPELEPELELELERMAWRIPGREWLLLARG